MKKYIKSFIVCMTILFGLTSCIDLHAFDDIYQPYYNDNNIVIVNDICYVYYTSPTTLFLNSLYVNDGRYYYRYGDRYIRVVFPNWTDWSQDRYFYYERNRWLYRDRYNYNNNNYRRDEPWSYYRGQRTPIYRGTTQNNLYNQRSVRVFTNYNNEGLIIVEGRR